MSVDNYIQVVRNALAVNNVTVSVGDFSVANYDLENATDVDEIIEACEATEAPIITFFRDGESLGAMMVLVGYGDESIADYHVNEFMMEITGDE